MSDLNNIPLEDIHVDCIVGLINRSDRTDVEGVAEFCVEQCAILGECEVSAAIGNKTTSRTVTQQVVDDTMDSIGASRSSIRSICTLLLLWRLKRKNHPDMLNNLRV